MSSTQTPIAEACEIVGGQAEMARLLSVTPSAVNQWCTRLRSVPAERCPEIERATRDKGRAILCEQLRPDVSWSVLRDAPKRKPKRTTVEG